MPALTDPRREAFAWGLAEGLAPLHVHRQCGFKAEAKNEAATARTMAARPSMVARVDEIRHTMNWAANADIGSVINELAWLVRKARTLDSAAALVAAKGMLSEVVKLKGKLGDADAEPVDPTPAAPPMSRAEWIAAYAPKG